MFKAALFCVNEFMFIFCIMKQFIGLGTSKILQRDLVGGRIVLETIWNPNLFSALCKGFNFHCKISCQMNSLDCLFVTTVIHDNSWLIGFVFGDCDLYATWEESRNKECNCWFKWNNFSNEFEKSCGQKFQKKKLLYLSDFNCSPRDTKLVDRKSVV